MLEKCITKTPVEKEYKGKDLVLLKEYGVSYLEDLVSLKYEESLYKKLSHFNLAILYNHIFPWIPIKYVSLLSVISQYEPQKIIRNPYKRYLSFEDSVKWFNQLSVYSSDEIEERVQKLLSILDKRAICMVEYYYLVRIRECYDLDSNYNHIKLDPPEIHEYHHLDDEKFRGHCYTPTYAMATSIYHLPDEFNSVTKERSEQIIKDAIKKLRVYTIKSHVFDGEKEETVLDPNTKLVDVEGLTTRSCNALIRAGNVTVNDVLKTIDNDPIKLFRITNLGYLGIRNILDTLRNYNREIIDKFPSECILTHSKYVSFMRTLDK